MIVRRTVLAVCLAMLVSGPALAVESTPQAFVESIYAAYKGTSDRSRGVPLTTDAAVSRYFEPQLAAVMIKDLNTATRKGEVPTLDGDPFIDGQEWEIEQLAVNVREQGTDKAQATVTFKNFGAPVSVGLDLVKGKDGWRIADIKWPERRTLRGLYVKR